VGSKEARESRQQRLAEVRRAQDRRRRKRVILWIAVAAVAVLAVAGGISWAVFSSNSAPSPLAAVKTFAVTSRDHTTAKVSYPQTPPVGGNHAQAWMNCGVYSTPVPNENAVHDLEHGAVWVTYRPGLPARQVDQLRQLAAGQTYLTVSPYPGLPAPVVASAWGVQLRLPDASDPRLAEFAAKYMQGPQTPEPGAPCTGGIGTPAQ
jgi:hypothetical protein